MLDVEFLKTRLGWFGAAWLAGFLAILIWSVSAAAFLGWPLVDAVDAALPAALLLLGVGTAGTLVQGLVAPVSPASKIMLVLLALVLVLPLLYAPVFGAVAGAYLTGSVIEYSESYAAFRITVGNLLYDAWSATFGGAAFQTLWRWFQAASTVIGFFAGLARLWPWIRRWLGGPQPTAEA